MNKLRPIIKCHGSKYYLCHKIIPLLPPHKIYVEAFGGGGNVLINKPVSTVEIFNDINKGLINLYINVVNFPRDFLNMINKFKYNKENFEYFKNYPSLTGLFMESVIYLIRNRMSRGGMGKTFAQSKRTRGGKMGDVNAWETFLSKHLEPVAERLKKVNFCYFNGIEVIKRWDSSHTTHYCDPPYFPSTRTAKKVFSNEMSIENHEELLDTLMNIKGRGVISGYHHPLYDNILSGWNLYEFEMPNYSGQNRKKQRRIECLWVSK